MAQTSNPSLAWNRCQMDVSKINDADESLLGAR